MGKLLVGVVCVLIISIHSLAWASPDQHLGGDAEAGELRSSLQRSLGPEETFRRTQAVLQHYGIAPEPSYQSEIQPLNGLQTVDGLTKILRAFDASNQFGRFTAFQQSSLTLVSFQD